MINFEQSSDLQRAAERVIADTKAILYSRDPLAWLLGDQDLKQQVFTQDEHDPSIAAKPFPDKAYIRWMVVRWLGTRQNLWEKSRQIMASLTFCALYLHGRPNHQRLLFASRNGTPWDQNLLLRRKFKPMLLALRIQAPRGTGFHAFRHFSASVMDRLNVPLKSRQQRLGHSDAAMTLGVYSHVAKEDDVRIAAQFGEILDPSGPFEKEKGPAVSQQALVN